jgi:hypothetical protein
MAIGLFAVDPITAIGTFFVFSLIGFFLYNFMHVRAGALGVKNSLLSITGNEKIVEVCETLANQGKRVIVAGLDMDYTGKPFGPIPRLLSIANYVTKLHAICMQCGGIASYSYRTTQNKDQVVLGEKEHYEARCRNCFHQ